MGSVRASAGSASVARHGAIPLVASIPNFGVTGQFFSGQLIAQPRYDAGALTVEAQQRRPAARGEGLEYAPVDGAALGERDLDGMKQRIPIAARVAVAEVKRGPSTARHHEADVVVDVMVEAETVGAADQLDVVTADRVQELRLALAEAAFGLGRVVTVQMRWSMH